MNGLLIYIIGIASGCVICKIKREIELYLIQQKLIEGFDDIMKKVIEDIFKDEE